MDDIKELYDIGVYGVVFGKAFYEGNITLEEIEKFMAQIGLGITPLKERYWHYWKFPHLHTSLCTPCKTGSCIC